MKVLLAFGGPQASSGQQLDQSANAASSPGPSQQLERPIGMLGLRQNVVASQHKLAQLFGLIVAPDWRRNTISDKLMSEMKSYLDSTDNITATMSACRLHQSAAVELHVDRYELCGLEPGVYHWKGVEAKRPLEDMLFYLSISNSAMQARVTTPEQLARLPAKTFALAQSVLTGAGCDLHAARELRRRAPEVPARSFATASIAEEQQVLSQPPPPHPPSPPQLSKISADCLKPDIAGRLCVPALLSDPLFAEASRIVNPSGKCKPVVAYRLTTTQKNQQLSAVFLWDVENGNVMVDEITVPAGPSYVDELHRSLVAAVKDLNLQRPPNSAAPLCSISVHVPVRQSQLIGALEELGWVPLAYLPSFVGTSAHNDGREDVVRLNFFPDALSSKELATQICTMASPAVKSPAHNCTNHAVFHTIKNALAEACNVHDPSAYQLSPAMHPWPRTVPVWPWRQLGWEDMVEEAWTDIRDELLSSMHQAQAVKVKGQF